MEKAYQPGEFVRYGPSGVCVISEIESMVSMDRRSVKKYYVLLPVANSGTKVFVPLDNPALLEKMHPVLTREEIDTVIRESAREGMDWISERNRRTEFFKGILKAGNPVSLMRLCRCLHQKRAQLTAQGKHLSGGDESALKQAEKLIESEFAFSLNIPRQEVGPYIHALAQAEGL